MSIELCEMKYEGKEKSAIILLALTSIPRLCASLIKSLSSFTASRPQLRVPMDEYRFIGEK